jgi:hypothetical protein
VRSCHISASPGQVEHPRGRTESRPGSQSVAPGAIAVASRVTLTIRSFTTWFIRNNVGPISVSVSASTPTPPRRRQSRPDKPTATPSNLRSEPKLPVPRVATFLGAQRRFEARPLLRKATAIRHSSATTPACACHCRWGRRQTVDRGRDSSGGTGRPAGPSCRGRRARRSGAGLPLGERIAESR